MPYFVFEEIGFVRRNYLYITLSFFILFNFSFVSCNQQTDESPTITPNETENQTENQTIALVAQEVPQQSEPEPANFSVSNLSVYPSEVLSGSPVYIQVLLTNNGDLEGTYEIRLQINETLEDHLSHEDEPPIDEEQAPF